MEKTKQDKQTTGVNNLTSLTQRPSKRSMLRRRIVLIRGAGHRRALVRSREHTAWTLFIPDVRTRAACVPKGGEGMKGDPPRQVRSFPSHVYSSPSSRPASFTCILRGLWNNACQERFAAKRRASTMKVTTDCRVTRTRLLVCVRDLCPRAGRRQDLFVVARKL